MRADLNEHRVECLIDWFLANFELRHLPEFPSPNGIAAFFGFVSLRFIGRIANDAVQFFRPGWNQAGLNERNVNCFNVNFRQIFLTHFSIPMIPGFFSHFNLPNLSISVKKTKMGAEMVQFYQERIQHRMKTDFQHGNCWLIDWLNLKIWTAVSPWEFLSQKFQRYFLIDLVEITRFVRKNQNRHKKVQFD